MAIFRGRLIGGLGFSLAWGLSVSGALAAPPSDPNDESPAAPVASGQIVGQVPATQVSNGTVATVTGSTTPAIYSNGLTGGTPNAIVVNGSATANNLNGTGLGVVTAQNGGTVDLGSGTVVNAQGSGSAAGIIGATGIFGRTASGAFKPTINAANVTVNATSDRAYGVYAHTDSIITLTGTTTLNITSELVGGAPSAPQGWGLVTNERGVLTAEDVTLTMTGPATGQINAISSYYGGSVAVTGNVQVTASGDNTYGVYARGTTTATTTTVNNISGTIHGSSFIWGVAAYGDATTTITGNANLTLSSDVQGSAIAAQEGATTQLTGSSSISFTAPTGYGIEVYDGGTVLLNNSQLSVHVADGAAIHSEAPAAATVSTITVNNSTLASDADGLVVIGGTANVALNNVTMTNASGKAIDVADNAGAAGTLDLTATNSTLTGSATTAAGSTSTVTLVDTLWNLTGNSNLTTLTNDPSLIDFSAPVGDPTLLASYKTLTVVNYIGDGGQIALNTYLAGDGSPSDMLVIDGGSATGTTGLIIKNSGGTGAETTGNGILVVNAINGGTTAAGAFNLVSPVVAGPYEYDLFRSSLDASGPENWYLRSTYRPDVSLISAVIPLQALYGRTLIDTYHERIGERALGAGELAVGPDGKGPVWGRVIGISGHHGGDPLGIFAGSEPSFDYKLFGVQAGVDLYRNDNPDWGGRDVGGVYAAIGTAWGDVEHPLETGGTVKAGTTSLMAWSLGGYWTHYFDNNAYIDALIQGTFYDISISPAVRQSSHTTGAGLAASLEAGYPISLSEGWVLEPQAQLVLQALGASGFNDGAADVSYSNTGSAVGRIGARLAHSFELDKGDGTLMPVTGWARVNLFHEFLGQPETTFSSAAGAVPFTADLRDTWVQLGVGGDISLSPNAKMFGQVSYDTTFDGKSHAVEGKLGFKVTW